MHLYVIARGARKHLKRWEEDLSEVYLPMEFRKGKSGAVQLAVRPVGLYELVFPEKELGKVLSLACGPSYNRNSLWNRVIRILAKILGLKQAQEPAERLNLYAVGVHVIGTKKDLFKDGIEQL